jgi:hypothetical protein
MKYARISPLSSYQHSLIFVVIWTIKVTHKHGKNVQPNHSNDYYEFGHKAFVLQTGLKLLSNILTQLERFGS